MSSNNVFLRDLVRSIVTKLVQKTYQRGVRLTKKAMDQLEKRFKRMEGLKKWFVKISPLPIEIME
jgi:hypothetical protein